MNQGLISEEIIQFHDLLIKSNQQQLYLLNQAVITEIVKRKVLKNENCF